MHKSKLMQKDGMDIHYVASLVKLALVLVHPKEMVHKDTASLLKR